MDKTPNSLPEIPKGRHPAIIWQLNEDIAEFRAGFQFSLEDIDHGTFYARDAAHKDALVIRLGLFPIRKLEMDALRKRRLESQRKEIK